jgi:hypothetical protein
MTSETKTAHTTHSHIHKYIHTYIHTYIRRAKKDLEKALKTAEDHISRQTKDFALLTSKCNDLQDCLGAKDGVSMYVCMYVCM